MPRKVKKVSSYGRSRTRTRINATTIARAAMREVNKLKASSGPHLVDTENLDGFDLAGSGSNSLSSHVTAIPEGDTQNSRNGETINVRSILLDGTIKVNTSQTRNMVHLALVQDLQQQSDSTAVYNGVFDGHMGSSSGNGLLNLSRDPDALGKYRVLWQKVYMVHTDTPYARFRKYIKFKKANKVVYNGSNSTDIQRNGIFLVGKCDTISADVGTNVPTIQFSHRIRFDP